MAVAAEPAAQGPAPAPALSPEAEVQKICALAAAAVENRTSQISPATSRYDAGMARAMATLATLAYCTPIPGFGNSPLVSCGRPCEKAGLRIARNRTLLVGNATDNSAYVSEFKRSDHAKKLPARGCIVAIRGTVLANVSAELRNQFVPWQSKHCPGCMVSTAYNHVWRALSAQLLSALGSMGCEPGDPVFVTGHSLGAAVATLTMFQLQDEGYDVQPSYNFGSPRVGNLAFATAFNRRFSSPVPLFRVTQANDVVPRSPSRSEGYASVGFQVWYPDDNAEHYMVCGSEMEDPGCGLDGLPQPCSAMPDLEGPHCQSPLAPVPTHSFVNITTRMGLPKMPTYGFCIMQQPIPMATGEGVIQGLYHADGECIKWSISQGMPGTSAEDAMSTESDPLAELAASRSIGRGGLKQPPPPTLQTPGASADDRTGLPAHMPNGPPCFRENVTYQPLGILGHGITQVKNASECQARCAAIPECRFFSFFALIGDCHVAGDNAYSLPLSFGWIGGPRSCEVGAGLIDEMGPACFQVSASYTPLDMVGELLTKEDSARSCQARCANTTGCARFSFFVPDGDCHVTDASAWRQEGSLGFVAGPAFCGLMPTAFRDQLHGGPGLAMPPIGAPAGIAAVVPGPLAAAAQDGVPAAQDVPPCSEANVTYQPLDMVGHLPVQVSNASSCQELCATTEGCVHFSFFTVTGDCHLASSNAWLQRFGSQGYVAGPGTCDGMVMSFISSKVAEVAGVGVNPNVIRAGAVLGASVLVTLAIATLSATGLAIRRWVQPENECGGFCHCTRRTMKVGSRSRSREIEEMSEANDEPAYAPLELTCAEPSA